MAEYSIRTLRSSGVYQIINMVNGKRYIGSASKFSGRFAVHRGALRQGTHHCAYLQRAWNKYGEDAFEFQPIIITSAKDAVVFEQRAMDCLSPEYNTSKTAGSCLGVKHSAETCAKRSALNIGNKFALGRNISESHRQAVTESNIRRKGFKRSPEAIAATVAAHRGAKRSPETCAKIAAKALGRKRSAESIAKGVETLRSSRAASKVRQGQIDFPI